MGKDMFVTSGLCRIREQIAASARKNVPSAEDPSESPREKGENENTLPPSPEEVPYSFEALPAETRRALILREEEFDRFRKEAFLRLHELELSAGSFREEAVRILEKCSSAEDKITGLKKALENLAELDRSRESYRKLLAANCRDLDRIRMEMLDVKELLELEPLSGKGAGGRKGSANLFAELDSVTFSQILRVASAFSLPLAVVLIFCALLAGVMMLLTFRVGL